MSVRIDGVMVLTAVGVIAAGGAAYLIKKKGGALLNAVNPASDKNIVNQGINNIAGSLGMIGKDQTLGTAFYDATHEEYDPNKPGESLGFSWGKTYDNFSPYVSALNPVATIGLGVAKEIEKVVDNGTNIGFNDYLGYLNPGSVLGDKALTTESGTDFKSYVGYLNPVYGVGKAAAGFWDWVTK